MVQEQLVIAQIAYRIWQGRGAQPSSKEQQQEDWRSGVSIYQLAIEDGVEFVYVQVNGQTVRISIHG